MSHGLEWKHQMVITISSRKMKPQWRETSPHGLRVSLTTLEWKRTVRTCTSAEITKECGITILVNNFIMLHAKSRSNALSPFLPRDYNCMLDAHVEL